MQVDGAVFKSDRHAGLLFHLIAVLLQMAATWRLNSQPG
jgi:hypothetical protein